MMSTQKFELFEQLELFPPTPVDFELGLKKLKSDYDCLRKSIFARHSELQARNDFLEGMVCDLAEVLSGLCEMKASQ